MSTHHYLAASAALTWLMLMAASTLRARAWTPSGFMVAVGNREDSAFPSAIAARADRAAKNMLENLVLFGIVVLAASVKGTHDPRVVAGAAIFFWARVAYFPIYLAGITILRTLSWAVAVGGLLLIASALV